MIFLDIGTRERETSQKHDVTKKFAKQLIRDIVPSQIVDLLIINDFKNINHFQKTT